MLFSIRFKKIGKQIFILGLLTSVFSCASFSKDKSDFNPEYTRCSTFKISGDNVVYKNMQIFAIDDYIYIKTPKINSSTNIRVYAVKNDGSLAIVQYWVDNKQNDYTIFKTPEGFAKYALKNDMGGVVYMSCEQNK